MLTQQSVNEYFHVAHNPTQRTETFFQNSLFSWNSWVLLSPSQLLRNHFLVSLPKKQQFHMAQPFDHFRWSFKRHRPSYYICNILISFCASQEKIKPTVNIFITMNSSINTKFTKSWLSNSVTKKKIVF